MPVNPREKTKRHIKKVLIDRSVEDQFVCEEAIGYVNQVYHAINLLENTSEAEMGNSYVFASMAEAINIVGKDFFGYREIFETDYKSSGLFLRGIYLLAALARINIMDETAERLDGFTVTIGNYYSNLTQKKPTDWIEEEIDDFIKDYFKATLETMSFILFNILEESWSWNQ